MKQHSVLTSILLHLLPGFPILAGMFLFAKPAFTGFFGLYENLGPLVGYLMSISIFLIPVQLVILLIASKKETGKFNVRAVINFQNLMQDPTASAGYNGIKTLLLFYILMSCVKINSSITCINLGNK